MRAGTVIVCLPNIKDTLKFRIFFPSLSPPFPPRHSYVPSVPRVRLAGFMRITAVLFTRLASHSQILYAFINSAPITITMMIIHVYIYIIPIHYAISYTLVRCTCTYDRVRTSLLLYAHCVNSCLKKRTESPPRKPRRCCVQCTAPIYFALRV